MTEKTRFPEKGRLVVGVFHDAAAFRRALKALIVRGFSRDAVSVLASHGVLKNRFSEAVPAAEDLAEHADAQREGLDAEKAVDAAIRFLVESISILGVIGAAGAAFAVGGPVGVAVGTGAATEATLENVLARVVGSGYAERYDEYVRAGGVVCWVRVHSPVEAWAARDALAAHGGIHVHEVEAP